MLWYNQNQSVSLLSRYCLGSPFVRSFQPASQPSFQSIRSASVLRLRRRPFADAAERKRRWRRSCSRRRLAAILRSSTAALAWANQRNWRPENSLKVFFLNVKLFSKKNFFELFFKKISI